MSSTNNIRKISAAGLLAIWLFLSGFSSTPPSRFEQVQQAIIQRGASAVVRESEQGQKFNKFFPAAEGEYKVVYSQEKKGFAQAKLKQNEKEVAVFTISDTINNLQAKDKFQQSTDKIGGYPAVSSGSKGTAVLAGLFQVKVMSKDPGLTDKEREAWLSKFDLNGLAAFNITVMTLRELNFVVPREWNNTVEFVNTIREVSGEEDEDIIQQIGDRAILLYNDKSQGYQRAMWLYETYETLDNAADALGAALLANELGKKIPQLGFLKRQLGFLKRLTPNLVFAQSIEQAIEPALKSVVKVWAFFLPN